MTVADSSTPDLPLAGIRVVELGRFAAGPACATILADWGADVVKIEPPDGDPARGPGSVGDAANPRFDVHNRSRRGLVLDLTQQAARAALDRMLAVADVFVTNVSPSGLHKLQIVPEDLAERHPRLVVAQVRGYEPNTEHEHRRSYDHGAFWAYSGAAALFADATGEPPQPTGGFGDRAAGSVLAAAIMAALFRRERTGRGGHVRTSLVNTALWLMASDVSDILATGHTQRLTDRRDVGIPTINCFRTADGRWLWLQLMIPEPHWHALLDALDAGWLDEDPRFKGGKSQGWDGATRRALIELLDEVFRSRRLADWEKRLTDNGITWAPVRSLEETVADPAIRASSAFVETDGNLSVNTPCTFPGMPGRQPTRAPRIGEHSTAVLADYGLSPDEIETLSAGGALGAQ